MSTGGSPESRYVFVARPAHGARAAAYRRTKEHAAIPLSLCRPHHVSRLRCLSNHPCLPSPSAFGTYPSRRPRAAPWRSASTRACGSCRGRGRRRTSAPPRGAEAAEPPMILESSVRAVTGLTTIVTASPSLGREPSLCASGLCAGLCRAGGCAWRRRLRRFDWRWSKRREIGRSCGAR